MSRDEDSQSIGRVSGEVAEMKQEQKQVQELSSDEDDIIQVDSDNNRVEEKAAPLDDDQEKQQSSELQDSGMAPAPDGGFVAWLQVACGFFAMFNSWGIVNAFGAYQQYYESNRLSNETSSTISWIGSILGYMVVTATIVFGRLVDAGYTRQVLIAGTILLSFGMMMTSLGDEFYQIFLAQGVCAGLGCSCIFVGAIANVASYFSKKRASALGIMASGSSLGGVIYPIMVRKLIPQVGFPWATRIIGFMIFGTCLFPTFFIFPRIKARKSGPLIDYASLRDVPFMLFSLGCFFGFIGLYVPIFYIQSFAKHIGFSEDLAGYMVTILSAGSVFGRLVPNFIADRTGSLNILIPCTVCAGILCFTWIAVDNHAGTIVFAVFYGFFSGTYVSVPAACVSMMTKDMSMIGTRLGMNFFFTGLGILIGTPVAGAIITRQDGSYLGAQIFAGVAVFLAAICVCAARIAFTGRKLMVKA
jgi:MFS family permease